MESKKINQLATELTPSLSDLTIIGDASTGISKKITLSQMASLFTGTVEEYANLAAFPLVGVADTIYIALNTNVLYRYNTGTNAYVELSPNIINSLVFNDANGFDGTISLVGSVANLTITTALTTGSVGFIGTSGALLEDNTNFFWNNSTKRLGINTNAPTTALDVFGSGIIGRINGTSTNNAFLGFASAGTNKWSIGNVQSDHRFRIYSEANSTELVSVLQTGEFGIGIANPLTKLHIFGGATALIANLDANTSVAKSISYRSGNSSRINLEVSGTESGSNAGANFFIRRYSDAGSLIDTPLTITRSTGAIDLSTALTATSGVFSSSLTATQLTLNTFASGRNLRLSSNPTGIEFFNSAGTVRNWQISAQSINDQSLDFTASTANGGTTYSTPLLSLQGVTSRATITGDLLVKKSGAPQAIFSIDGTTGLFFRDGTNAAWKSWQIATSYNDGSDLSFMPSTNTSGAPTWGSTVLVLQGNGRVGINVTTPASLLSMGGVTSQASLLTYTPSIARQSFFNTYYSNVEGLFPQFLDIVSYGQPDGTNGGSNIRFLTNSVTSSSAAVERMRITSDGALENPFAYNNTTGNSPNMFVTTTGRFVRSTASSQAFKENITDWDLNGLDTILALKPKTFTYKEDYYSNPNRQFLGLIAEEVAQVSSYLADYENEDGTGEVANVRYANIVVPLVKAVQELKAEIEELKALIAAK